MNLPVSTPSILHKKHDYGTVEGTKYLDAFPRTATDPLAAGFKFGYWGQDAFSPDNASRPLRSCVGEVKVGSKASYVSPPVEAYHRAVDSSRSPSPTRAGSMSASRQDARSPSPQRQRSKSPQRGSSSPSARRVPAPAASDFDFDRKSGSSKASPRRGREDARSAVADTLYLESVVQQNTNLDRALVLERESRRVLERELREETRARKLLEGSLEEASVSFHRAKERLRALGAENEDLRRQNEDMLARFAALEQKVGIVGMAGMVGRLERCCCGGGGMWGWVGRARGLCVCNRDSFRDLIADCQWVELCGRLCVECA